MNHDFTFLQISAAARRAEILAEADRDRLRTLARGERLSILTRTRRLAGTALIQTGERIRGTCPTTATATPDRVREMRPVH